MSTHHRSLSTWPALLLAASLGSSGCAHAREMAYPEEVAYNKNTVIDFSDLEIEGELTRPEGAYLESRKMMRLPNPADELLEAAARDASGGNAPGKGGGPLTRTAGSAQPYPPPDHNEQTVALASEPESKRLVIYTGQMVVVVPDWKGAVTAFLAETEKLGGYMQNQHNNSVTVRVPAEQLDALIEFATAQGLVTEKQVDARDVTKQVTDIGIRIDNLKRARERLVEILQNAQKTSDILQIERELNRVTTELETMKGQLATLKDQISLSTLTVRFEANAPEATSYRQQKASPFAWINALGVRHLLDRQGDGYRTLLGPRLDLPAEFLLSERSWEHLFALSADEVRLNYRTTSVDGGDLTFWRKALVKDFEQNRGYVVKEQREISDEGGTKGVELVVETRLGGRLYRYHVSLFVEEGAFGNRLRIIEIAGQPEQVEPVLEALRTAIKGA